MAPFKAAMPTNLIDSSTPNINSQNSSKIVGGEPDEEEAISA
jgi:hypothetical protein